MGNAWAYFEKTSSLPLSSPGFYCMTDLMVSRERARALDSEMSSSGFKFRSASNQLENPLHSSQHL